MTTDAEMVRRGALAVQQYVDAHVRYRSFTRKTRPPEVTAAFESAKRRLDRARGDTPNCPSPHLNVDRIGCSTCPRSCYRKRVIVL